MQEINVELYRSKFHSALEQLRASNETHSMNSEVKPETKPTSVPEPPIGDQSDRVLTQDESTRYLFFFADKEPHVEYRLIVRGTGLEPQTHPFQMVNKIRSAYLCILHSTGHDLGSALTVSIEKTKQHKNQWSVVEHDNATPKMDPHTKTWRIAAKQRCLFLDFHNYGRNWIGSGISKDIHYETILESIILTLFKLVMNHQLSPRAAYYLIFKTSKTFGRTKRNNLNHDDDMLDKDDVVDVITAAIEKQYNEIKHIISWTEMSIPLICLASLWSLSLETTSITDKQIADTLQAVYSPDRGSPTIIVQNIRQIFQKKEVHVLQSKLAEKVKSKYDQDTIYIYGTFCVS